MDKFITLLASGLLVGSVMALTAVGFLILYKATGVVNFAHGDMMTLGAYLAFWATSQIGLPVLGGYGVALGCMVLMGLVLQRVVFVPLRGMSSNVVLIATLAIALIIEAVLALWQGPDIKSLATPVGSGVIHIAGAPISYQTLLIIGVAIVIVVAAMWVFRYTQFGREVRALAADEPMAMLSGIRVRRLSGIAFVTSAVFAGLAGILLASAFGLNLTFGFAAMITAFGAAIVGGFGSIGGAVAAALGLGLVQQLLGGYVFTNYSAALPYVVILIVIILRPRGLFLPGRQARV
jgi:branched-chain amino acid transport system permease protein